ncbi:hypothetical protein DFQ28_007748 [Apophysomyces sp. BC1034]|nr:hypothetical protein DFQ30_007630 [Apophysomyces sp. BC1015]KAG0176079.1 hypothetical protein DFQ29_006599 [Apophysomyces sp. BC1021]KAG0186459.1 hypothetical protein DFQ28_007748 [Apophysomyces sp. BC1034]
MGGRGESRGPAYRRYSTPPRSQDSPSRNGGSTRTSCLVGNERSRLQPASYLYRTEHDLGFTDRSLIRLSSFTNLVELRLCFPTITAAALTIFFQSAIQLQIFELRMVIRNDNGTEQVQQADDSQDFLQGIEYAKHLREIYLYSVWLSDEVVDHLCKLKVLKHITVCNGGNVGERKPGFLRQWLLLLPLLETLRIGKMSWRWDLIDDIIQKVPLRDITLPRIQQANGGLLSSDMLTRTTTDGDITFHKRGDWEWFWGAGT